MAKGAFGTVIVVLAALAALSFVGAFFLWFGSSGQFRWELLVHALVISIAAVLVARSPGSSPALAGRCPFCQARVFPTRRSSDYAKLWTCSGCGFEIARTWTRPRPMVPETSSPSPPPHMAPPQSGTHQ